MTYTRKGDDPTPSWSVGSQLDNDLTPHVLVITSSADPSLEFLVRQLLLRDLCSDYATNGRRRRGRIFPQIHTAKYTTVCDVVLGSSFCSWTRARRGS